MGTAKGVYILDCTSSCRRGREREGVRAVKGVAQGTGRRLGTMKSSVRPRPSDHLTSEAQTL